MTSGARPLQNPQTRARKFSKIFIYFESRILTEEFSMKTFGNFLPPWKQRFSRFWQQNRPQFRLILGTILGAENGALRDPFLAGNTRNSKGFRISVDPGMAPFWSSFGSTFGLRLGSFLGPLFGIHFGWQAGHSAGWPAGQMIDMKEIQRNPKGLQNPYFRPL